MADISRVLCLSVFTFFVLFTLKDVFVLTKSNAKEIPLTKVGITTHMGPILNFKYCYSCGYQKAFQEYGSIIQQKYPRVVVEGEPFNPSDCNMFLSNVFSIAKMLMVLCVLIGVNVFAYLGVTTPEWWWMWSMIVFFLCNALENHFGSTGAFEISFNDMPVWSKLETGRIPQPPELFQIIDNHLQFQTTVELKPGFAK